MDEERKQVIERLRNASPLEATSILQEMELYDAKSSQEIIDEVYEQFESGEHLEDEILKPVFMAVVDGLLEATAGGRAARKKGLTASRVLQECEHFSYDGTQETVITADGYMEYKNARHEEMEYQLKKAQGDSNSEYRGEINSGMTQEYDRKNYEDKKAMNAYKENRVVGEKTLVDEYTGKRNLYLKQDNPNQHYKDDNHRKQANPDHIVPLKQIHEDFKHNYALDDSDIKRIANSDGNLAVTSAEINKSKQDKTNEEFIDYVKKEREKGNEDVPSLDEYTIKNMKKLQKEAEKNVRGNVNKTVAKNLTGQGEPDAKAVKDAIAKFEEGHDGEKPSKVQEQEIIDRLRKEKTKEIQGKTAKKAASQATDYAVGNLILFIVKPVYYEMADIFKNGMQEGVNAETTLEALKIRFGRIKRHVLTHAKDFLGDSVWDFVKGFVSSLIEGIISLFAGIFKQILKLIKEGIKIFVRSAKILFGKDADKMSASEKGDAIIKLIGTSVISIAGIGIEALLNKIGIQEPWSVVLSTMLSGIASALFMYVLDKIDLFDVKAEKRRDRIVEIFNERIQDIHEAAKACDVVAIDKFKRQREEFESAYTQIDEGIEKNDIHSINEGLYKVAEFLNVKLPYSNTEEFCDYMDSEDAISL